MIIKKTSGNYERNFERLFKAFEIEMVRFNRLTQATTKKRERIYISNLPHVKDCQKIQITLAYQDYDLRFTMIPNLKTSNEPSMTLSMDYVYSPNQDPLILPIDMILEPTNFTPALYQDLLNEDLLLEAIEAFLDLFRKVHGQFQTLSSDPSAREKLKTLIEKDTENLSSTALTPLTFETWLDHKRQFATTTAVKFFLMGHNKASLEAFDALTIHGGLYESRIKAALQERLDQAIQESPSVLPALIHKNYDYTSANKEDLYHAQKKKSYALAYVISFLPMAVLNYFVMGYFFWALTLYSYYKTGVNTWFGLIPLLISTFFAAIWSMPIAHAMLFPKDHELYRAHQMRHKHDRKTIQIKLSSLIVIVMMLTVSAWNGTNLMVFNQGVFTLAPGFMWIPPINFESYRVLDHMEYRSTITTDSGKTEDYYHYVLIYKDGKEVLLKPYLDVYTCEDILVPFMERKNVKTIR